MPFAPHSLAALTLLAFSISCVAGGSTGTPTRGRPAPIIVVSMDTMRPDKLGAWGGPPGLTPSLDRFSAESVAFTSAYAQSNETLFSHASLFTGRYPSELGRLTYSFRLPDAAPTLAEVLGHYGYRGMASVAGGHLSADFGFSRGFEVYASSRDWGSLHDTLPPALHWVDSLPEGAPFFLFLHGYDCHYRYLKPAPFGLLHARRAPRPFALELAVRAEGTTTVMDGSHFPQDEPLALLDYGAPRIWGPEERERLSRHARNPGSRAMSVTPEDLAFFRALYDGAVSHADLYFGLLMAELEHRDLLERVWIAVISDHGEELGEKGLFNHRFTMSDEALHTVLMIRPPGGVRAPARFDGLVSLFDLSATLLEVASATPPTGSHGRSLLPVLEGRAFDGAPHVVSEGAFRLTSLRTPTTRLTFAGVSPESRFFDPLLSMADLAGPSFEVQPARAAGELPVLRERLVAWRQGLHPLDGLEAHDPALLEALRARGYWEHN